MRPWWSLLSVALVAACVPQNAGYDNVRNVVSRTGQEVRRRSAESNARVDSQARALLTEPLTAHSAVQVALLNSAELQATLEEVGMARADLVLALRLPNPTAEGGLQFGHEGPPALELLRELLLLPMRNGAAQAEFAAVQYDG